MDRDVAGQERMASAGHRDTALRHPAGRELCAVTGSRLDTATLAHDYLCMISSTVAAFRKLAVVQDPTLAGMLNVVAFLAENGEQCLASEADAAQQRLDALQRTAG
ncbi:hypothetical protein [Chitiniphilus eburneus]|uniref:Uncharacterized protein n=1 Tax=Chitiniphilus eburneus TaxID=2571148 RepID=A0A4U0PPW0_9NEIS|nr:hypothetical protein [Chitiniphilus eburneus]TJZ65014.1 hypothetical protein FAZ21_18725 [Chitiniphilus eburneus]